MILSFSLATYTAIFFNIASWWMMRKHYKKAGLFNPVSIFFAVWLLNLLGYEMDRYFGYFCYRLTSPADFWLTLTFVVFFGGAWVALLMRQKNSVVSDCPPYYFKKLWHSTLFFLALFMFAIICKYMLIIYHYHGLLGHFGAIKEDIMNHQFHFPFILYFFTLPEYLVGINLGILTVLNRKKLAISLSVITLFLAYCNASFSGMRGGFLNYFLLYFSSVGFTFIVNNKVKLCHYIYVFCIIMGLFLILALGLYMRSANHLHDWRILTKNPYSNQIKMQHSSFILQDYYDRSFIKGVSNFLDGPRAKPEKSLIGAIPLSISEAVYVHNFMYFVGTIPAYSYFLEHPWDSEYWGKWTFYGIYSALKELSHAMHLPTVFVHLDEKAYYASIITGPYNSTNYLTYIFSDFGFAGLVVLPFIFGFISNWVFLRAMDTKKMNYIQFMSVISAGLIMTVRGMITNGVYFWALCMLIIIQNGYVFYKYKKNIRLEACVI